MQNMQSLNSLSLAFASAGLAIGTTTSTFKTANSVAYAINGVFATAKGATDNIAFTAGHTTLATGQACAVAILLDSAGTVTTVQGPIVASTDTVPMPAMPLSRVCIGVLKMVNNSGSNFVFGTTALSAITVTYNNTCAIPGASL